MWPLTVCAFAAMAFLLFNARRKNRAGQSFECRFQVSDPDRANEFSHTIQLHRAKLAPGRMKIFEAEGRLTVSFSFGSSVSTARNLFRDLRARPEVTNLVMSVLSDRPMERTAKVIPFPEKSGSVVELPLESKKVSGL